MRANRGRSLGSFVLFLLTAGLTGGAEAEGTYPPGEPA